MCKCNMQDLRRSNFTAADCRDCNFKNTKLQGTYFIKTVVARANFEVRYHISSPSRQYKKHSCDFYLKGRSTWHARSLRNCLSRQVMQ